MATSLAEQLQRLKAPQTSLLFDSKKRPSIIFDNKEAATKDRKTIFELGQNGLSDLIAINPTFTQFEQTLFDQSSIELERSVEDAKVNELLNKLIKKFFYHLSPYFMLQPSHLCLEWLIRRFHIQQFNVDEFIDLILPYHETQIFVRCLHIINLNEPTGKWKWLEATQKCGTPLSKTALQNRAANDTAFLKMICNSTIEAIKELDYRSNTLQTKINFYCITIISALEKINKINELHISSILRGILKGFSSNSLDFAASSLMITAQLMSKCNLKTEILQSIITKICSIEHKSLQIDIILLLILIFQSQKKIKVFPEELLINFISKKTLTTNLRELSDRKVKVSQLCVPLIKTCFEKIHSKDSEWVKYTEFLTNLFNDVQFQEIEAKDIIRSILENDQNAKKDYSDDDIVELDSDDESELLQDDIKKLYSNYLHQLEKQYPTAFDCVVKETMQEQNNISEKRRQALKSILAFRLKSSYSEDNSSIYENLYHPNSINRIAAVKYVVDNFDALTVTEESKTMIRDSMIDRLSDDDQQVLIEVLKISSSNFSKIMNNKIFFEKLLEIFHKTHFEKDNWSSVKPCIVKHITSLEIVKINDINQILLTLLPLLVSNHETDLNLLKEISKNDSIQYIPFLKEYFNLKLNKQIMTIKDFEKVIHQIESIPTPESILNSFETVNHLFYYNSVNCSFILLFLGYSFSKYTNTDVRYRLKGFEIFEIIKKNIKFVSQSEEFLQTIKPNKICLTIVLNYLLSLLKGIEVDTKNFRNTSENSKLLRKIFEVIVTKAFVSKHMLVKEEYSICLQNLLKQTFTNSSEKFEYLSYYFVIDRINVENINYETQIRVIKLFNLVINGNKNDFNIHRNILIRIILGLGSKETIIRQIALNTLENILKLNESISENDIFIIEKILESNQEITMDEIQITIVFYTLLCPDKTNKKGVIIAKDFLNSILKILNDDNEDVFLKSLLLKIMKLTNNENILNNLIDLGCKILEDAKKNCVNSRIGFDYYTGEIYQNIVEKFDADTISIIEKNKNSWSFIEDSLKNYKILININGRLQSIASVIMNVFETDVYAKMSTVYKENFLHFVLEAMSLSDENSVSSTGSKLIRRVQLDGNHIKNILNEMKNLCSVNSTPNRRASSLSIVDSLKALEWKIGITFLELLQNMKNIENVDILIPILFDLLKICLEFEEQVALDYAKQLILSCLINLCKKAEEYDTKSRSKLKENALKMDLVVQCIRTTQNPQTHHHALMLLSHCAYIVPQQVLLNITNVFTFMGSSVVRHDDSFSFQILSNLIESVIPMLVEACNNDDKSGLNNKDRKVIPILKVFSDIILDVPEHRRLLLYSKLIQTLGAQKYLWIFMCILFESHVINEEKEKHQKLKVNRQIHTGRSLSPEELPKRISIALNLCKNFEHAIMIETCISLFDYLRKLPESKPNENNEMSVDEMEFDTSMFDVGTHTEKQLRHYKFSLLQFMSALTSSPEFENSIAKLNQKEIKEMKSYYQNFIIKILSFIPSVTTSVEKNSNTNQHKYWKIILHHCTEILDNAISLLSPDILLVVVHGLMQHQIPVVRKRVIELLNTKLQYKTDYFSKCNKQNMIQLLEPLQNVIKSILNKETLIQAGSSHNEEVNIQHLSLIAVKLLSKTLALTRVEEFKEILTLLAKILKKRSSVSKIITAAVVLAISEVSSNLKAHSISNLYKFMPLIIEVLNDEAEGMLQQAPDNISIAILAGIYKLFDSLPLFLGPYYLDTFTLLIKIWVILDNRISDNRISLMYTKLNLIWTKISITIPLRLLIPHCEKVYNKLMDESNYKGVIYLMKLLNESFNNASGTDITVLQNDLTKFFLTALDIRSNLDNYNDMNEINEIETHIVQTFVCLILKLSESSFRPLYQKLYDWAIRSTQNDKDKLFNRSITYFALSSKIAESLKSLFVLFASDFIQDAANLLVDCNAKKTENNDKFKNPYKSRILLENILNTLYNIFLYDSQGFLNTHRFDILMQPIANQIENPLIIDNVNLQQILLNCISQLIVVVSNDVLWKQLNYEILLKCRTNQAEVKLLAIQCSVEIAKKIGDDFSTLLPETIPFLAELLEDENEIVEKAARKAVQELEKVVGESLQKYF